MHHAVTAHWRQPPTRLDLQPERIDVWRIDLDRAGRRHHPASAAQASRRGTARQVLLDILAAHLGATVRPLRIALHPGGKPYLADPAGVIAFNLSHAQELCLLAVGCDCDLGIDVEQRRRIDNPLRLAQRALSTAELSHLHSLPDDQRSTCFLDLWTRMESRQKALGRGIFSEPADPERLSSISFQPSPGQFACVSVSPPCRELRLRFFDYRAR